MPRPYEGGCLCGAIRYRVDAEPLALYVCHCTDCQRQTGTSFASAMIVPKSAFELLRGEPRAYAALSPEGWVKRGKFCDACATRVWGLPARFPEVLVLRPGTLDDTTWLSPAAHIWTRSRQPWVVIPKDAVAFERQPEDPMALVEAWRRRAAR